jgi:hypothetical protein
MLPLPRLARGIRHHRLLYTTPRTRRALHHPSVPARETNVLAIETSCDDTAVCLLSILEERDDEDPRKAGGRVKALVRFNGRATANNAAFGGIHPLVGKLLSPAVPSAPS